MDTAAWTLEHSRRPLRDECKQQAILRSLDEAESLQEEEEEEAKSLQGECSMQTTSCTQVDYTNVYDLKPNLIYSKP